MDENLIDIREMFNGDNYLSDGVYSLYPNTQYLFIDSDEFVSEEDYLRINNFIETYPDYVYAEPYEVHGLVLLSKKPVEFNGRMVGTGFNYGSLNLIEVMNAPQAILILAEND